MECKYENKEPQNIQNLWNSLRNEDEFLNYEDLGLLGAGG